MPCAASPWTMANPKCSPAPRFALKYDDPDKPAPITESQILMPRRFDDRRPDLWSVFNRTQENLTKAAAWPQRQRAPTANPPGAGHRPKHPTKSRPLACWPMACAS